MKSILIPLIWLKRVMLLLTMLIPVLGTAQVSVPFKIENHSELPDNQLFIAIVGEDLSVPSNHIWVDPATGAQLPMSPAYNTVQGPVYGGNQGPGQNGMYADCFKRLSEISNNTVMVPPIQGCRIFIAYEEQLYFYFFGASGAQNGYTSPNATDPTDPNQGIRYEIIELTNNQYGMFANTTRVDSYQYPIGMELFGSDGYHKKMGEIATHEEIVAAFQASVPTEFQKCLDPETGEITAPSKTPEFADGSVGTMPVPGPYVNYMKPYVDAVWNKYANEDLIFDAGDAGIWKGRVQGEQLIMISQSPAFFGRKAIITRRPTTQEVFEGKGVLDNVVQDATTDLLVQAQICAAFNRHIIDINTTNPGLQDWSDDSKYYQASPCNHYAKFWHQQGISLNQLSYGFAYDDVFSYSSSVHTPKPTQVIINIGPYEENSCTPTMLTPFLRINGAPNQQTSVASLLVDDTIILSPESGINGAWLWSGPNNFSSSSREITISNIQINEAGEYEVSFINSEGCQSSVTYSINVDNPVTGCSASVNSDFSVNVTNDAATTYMTFVPERAGVAQTTCILYYSTSPNGSYPGYLVSANTPYQINASNGETIYYYYTYSIPEGGESNTFNNKQSFEAGECGDTNPGTGITVPAKIQAEDYTSMYGIQLEATSDTDGNLNVGYIDTGDWLEYEIYVPEAGNYTIDYRIASLNAGGTIEFFANGVSKEITNFGATGGWQNWTTISATVNLTAGNQTIRLVSGNSGWNINWLAFKSLGNPPSNDGCSISVNSDFSIQISDDSSNPTLTFIPNGSGVGSPTCILYYSTSVNGPYPGYLVSANTPYQINAGSGQTIYFYYTYSLPEGGENNTLNNKKSFVVGNCSSGSSARISTSAAKILENTESQSSNSLMLYPNPAYDKLNIAGLPQESAEITIYDASGKRSAAIKTKNEGKVTFDILQLTRGLHFIRVQTKTDVIVRAFVKE